ncbi:MAG: site-specific DNA-methyltransferase [Elusimicrobia bacterium]|nr:site-specific DNA-methyltransferase [Elusimicrobiota bacterium]
MTTPHPLTLDTSKQNAHLTFKQNQHMGRHGWLRLTPAYSVQLVSKILEARRDAAAILDPFSGTGTTALCAAYMGLTATGLELNPFLVWFSSIKFRRFSATSIEEARSLGAAIAAASSSASGPTANPPPIHNIERWWDEDELRFLCKLKACILDRTEQGTTARDLLLVAFCRTLITLSNAAFNHQSMSFKDADKSPTLFSMGRDNAGVFGKELAFVLDGATDNPRTLPSVMPGDARQASRFLGNKFDLVITSPPYPNRISYIRELRPYMYWLGFLADGRDAGEHDWRAIGGTWGVATSRLADWKPSGNAFTPAHLRKSLVGISDPKNENGRLLANYVAKYFEDMWQHLSDIGRILNTNAEVHYVVGNSTFYGTLLPVEDIFKAMLQEAGFADVSIVRLRKRNSKAELFEFDVTARKSQSSGHSIVCEPRRVSHKPLRTRSRLTRARAVRVRGRHSR